MVLLVLCLKHKRLFRPSRLSVHIAKWNIIFVPHSVHEALYYITFYLRIRQ